MTIRDEIIAISEYYNIPMTLAKLRRDTIGDLRLEEILVWWLDKKEGEKE